MPIPCQIGRYIQISWLPFVHLETSCARFVFCPSPTRRILFYEIMSHHHFQPEGGGVESGATTVDGPKGFLAYYEATRAFAISLVAAPQVLFHAPVQDISCVLNIEVLYVSSYKGNHNKEGQIASQRWTLLVYFMYLPLLALPPYRLPKMSTIATKRNVW